MIKQTIWLIGCFLMLHFIAGAQQWEFVHQIGGLENDGVNALEVSTSQIVIGGTFEGDLSLEGTELTAVGEDDLFVASYDPEGNVNWIIAGGGPDAEEIADLVIDQQEHVICAGSFWFDSQFDTLTLEPAVGSKAIFLLKYDTDGNVVWGRALSSPGLKFAGDIATDPSDNIYLTGFFEESLILEDTVLTSNGTGDLFLARFSPEGQLDWITQAGILGTTRGESLRVDETGNSYVGGIYQGRVAFGEDTIQTNTPDNDIFLAKFDAEGIPAWGRKAGGVFDDKCEAIELDEDGNIYMTGTYFGLMRLSDDIFIQTPGNNENFFLLKYQNDGTPLWARSLGESGFENGRDISLSGNWLLLTGFFNESFSIDGVTLAQGAGNFDTFIAALDLDGQLRFLKALRGSELALGEEIFITEALRIFHAGSFSQEISYDGEVLTATGAFDIYWGLMNAGLTPLVDIEKVIALKVFPNPASSQLVIETDLTFYTIAIWDLSGRRVLQCSNCQMIDIQHLSEGVYTLQLDDGAGTQTFVKFVKSNH